MRRQNDRSAADNDALCSEKRRRFVVENVDGESDGKQGEQQDIDGLFEYYIVVGSVFVQIYRSTMHRGFRIK